MIFSNISIYTIIIFILLSIALGFFISKIFTKDKNKIWWYFLFISFLLTLFTIFWPKWWLKQQNVEVSGTNIGFVLDVSKSMNAIDSENTSNSRIDISKKFISDFITKYSNNRYSLTIFSGEALKILPFTFDKDLYYTFLYDVDERNLSKQWTNIIEAIKVWLSSFSDEDENWVIIVFTDWWEESSEDFWTLKKELKSKNISLVLVWVWSTEWSYIPTWVDVFWRALYKVYNGERVITKLNESVLNDISNNLNWEYYRLDKLTKINNLEKVILWDIEKSILKKDLEKRLDLTRYFIILAFIFWLVFLSSLAKAKFRN